MAEQPAPSWSELRRRLNQPMFPFEKVACSLKDPLTGRVQGTLVFPEHQEIRNINPLPISFYREEEYLLDEFLTSLRHLHEERGVAVFVPPGEWDDGLADNNPLLGEASVQGRAYICVFSRESREKLHYQSYFSTPATTFYLNDEKVPSFLARMRAVFGVTLRVVPHAAIKIHWGGRLDEYGYELWPHQGFIDLSKVPLISREGISVDHYLTLIEDYPPHDMPSYEAYFRYLSYLGLHQFSL